METITQRFNAAIQNFMRSPAYATTRKLRARVFIDDFDPEIARLKILEIVEMAMRALERADVRRQEKAARADDSQMKFLGPGFAELFVSTGQRLPLKSGKKKAFDLMTGEELNESAEVYLEKAKQRASKDIEQDERRARYLKELAVAMAPYTETNPALTFRDFRELRASEGARKTRTAGEP